jgi:hypothetical protein
MYTILTVRRFLPLSSFVQSGSSVREVFGLHIGAKVIHYATPARLHCGTLHLDDMHTDSRSKDVELISHIRSMYLVPRRDLVS